MKIAQALLTAALCLLMVYADLSAEIKTYTHTVEQPFGGSQSPDDARVGAIAKAKREVLEMAGTYLESLSVVKAGRLEKDEVLALASGVLNAEILSQENYTTADAFGIRIKVKVDVDTGILETRVKGLLQDAKLLNQYEQVVRREKELLQKIASLQSENRQLASARDRIAAQGGHPGGQGVQSAFKQASQDLAAVERIAAALKLKTPDGYTDPWRAIAYLSEAIELNPKEAIAYNNRAHVFGHVGDNQRAMADYKRAIALKPNDPIPWLNRGSLQLMLGDPAGALADLNRSVHLGIREPVVYLWRGSALDRLQRYAEAVADFTRCLDQGLIDAGVYSSRGGTYLNWRRYGEALADYNTAIQMEPDNPFFYLTRADVFAALGDFNRMCADYHQACRKGDCNAWQIAIEAGSCRWQP